MAEFCLMATGSIRRAGRSVIRAGGNQHDLHCAHCGASLVVVTNQSAFAELCGVTRQAVLKWKQEGNLVMQDARVDVDASLARLGRVRKSGSPASNPQPEPEIVEIALEPGESLDDAASRLVGEIDADATSFDEARASRRYISPCSIGSSSNRNPAP
jgi:hypothetical protein